MSDYTIIQPKRPEGEGWEQFPVPTIMRDFPFDIECWMHTSGLSVLSAVEAIEEEIGPEYHLSVSKANLQTLRSERCSSIEGLWVCNAFGIPEAEEDNHVGGITRNYWRPVADKFAERVCPCKADEPAIVEDNGDYVWRPLE